jgi:protein ImuB
MNRVLYVFLTSWPIDRLRRAGLLPPLKHGAQPAKEAPFASVTAVAGRQLLAAVNPEAAAKGLAAGMPLADALSFLPGLATRPAEPAEDEAALRRLAQWCTRYSPWTAPDRTDGVKIEITGSAHLWGGEAELAADLSRRLARQGLAHRLAIADTIGAAWGVARHARADETEAAISCQLTAGAAKIANFIVAPGTAREAIAPLPVSALRLDSTLVQGLHHVGLRRIGEIMAMPRDALARRFGEIIGRRLDQALGHLPEPLSPMAEPPTRRVRLSFAEPIVDSADFARATERLTQDLVVRLAREGVGVRRLELGFHRVDGRVEHIRSGTARPSRDPVHLARLMISKLDTVDPGLGVEDAILAAFAVEPLAPEPLETFLPLKEPPRPPSGGKGRARRVCSEPALDTPLTPTLCAGKRGERERPLLVDPSLAVLFDRLGAKLGLDALARLEARESHIPERASVAVPVGDNPHPNPAPLAGQGMQLQRQRLPPPSPAGGEGSGWTTPGAATPRPVRLFAPPEPIEAFWVLPDDPPFQFTWRCRAHRVTQADGAERIAEEWWRPDGQLVDGAGNPDAIRDYYRVEDETGRRFWLFRAGLPGVPPPRWFVHGLFA